VNQKFRDVEALIRLFEQSGWHEMSLEVEGLSLVLSNDPAAGQRRAEHHAPLAPANPTAMARPPAMQRPAEAPPAIGRDEPVPEGLVAVRAPNLGTFYRAPKPGAAPYVEVDQLVEPETEVCLIEVMKLFTPVKAGVRGRVVRICVEDGQMVDYDAPLFYIEPAA
jgi:acetyl-CoA carboxylase biotin carboxyl carrier protein